MSEIRTSPSLSRAGNGQWYGLVAVLLTRVQGDGVQQLLGRRPPFGPIIVDRFEGKNYVEEWDEFWEEKGFEILEPKVLREARMSARESYRAMKESENKR